MVKHLTDETKEVNSTAVDESAARLAWEQTHHRIHMNARKSKPSSYSIYAGGFSNIIGYETKPTRQNTPDVRKMTTTHINAAKRTKNHTQRRKNNRTRCVKIQRIVLPKHETELRFLSPSKRGPPLTLTLNNAKQRTCPRWRPTICHTGLPPADDTSRRS